MPLLDVKNLTVSFDTSAGLFHAVKGIDIHVDAREVLAIVGESGSGKSVSMLSVMGLLPNTATVTADRMEFDGQDLLKRADQAMYSAKAAGRARLVMADNAPPPASAAVKPGAA